MNTEMFNLILASLYIIIKAQKNFIKCILQECYLVNVTIDSMKIFLCRYFLKKKKLKSEFLSIIIQSISLEVRFLTKKLGNHDLLL